jgi:hypothetical protein
MGDTPERERSVPMENVEEVKKKSKGKENRGSTTKIWVDLTDLFIWPII